MFQFEHDLIKIKSQNDLIIRILFSLLKGEEYMSAELDALVAQVTLNTSAEASAVALIQHLADEIHAAVATNDSAALADLATKLKASSDALGAAIVANTEAVAAPVVADPAPVVVADPAPVAADPVVVADPAVDPAAPTA